jgi:hypothetical protein
VNFDWTSPSFGLRFRRLPRVSPAHYRAKRESPTQTLGSVCVSIVRITGRLWKKVE